MKIVSFLVFFLIVGKLVAGPTECDKECKNTYNAVAGIDEREPTLSHVGHCLYRHTEEDGKYSLLCNLVTWSCTKILSCSFLGVQCCREDGHNLSLGPCGACYDFLESDNEASWKSCFGCFFGGTEKLKGYLGMCGITCIQCDEQEAEQNLTKGCKE